MFQTFYAIHWISLLVILLAIYLSMALLSLKIAVIKSFDENKSKSCIILEIGCYLCHNGIRETLSSWWPSVPSTRQSLIFLSNVLVLKIRAYHLLLTTFSILQIARNQTDLTKDVRILVWFDITCAYKVDSRAWKPACNAPLRPHQFRKDLIHWELSM